MTFAQLRDRLPMIVALAIAVLLFGAGLAIANYEDQAYRSQQIKDTTEEADILAASAAAAVAFDDTKTAQEYVNALKVNPDLLAARLLDKQQKTIAHFSRGEPDAGGANIRVLAPVIQNGQVLGSAILVASAEPVARRVTRYVGLILLGTMGALVIAVLSVSSGALRNRAQQLSLLNERLRVEMEERERTEEALRQSQKLEAIGQLSGGIAHDFNNLIMIVKSNLGVLKRRFHATTEGARYLGAAEDALERAASLTQRILAFSRRQALVPRPIQLSELVREMADLIRHSVTEAIRVETDLKSQWWTSCDMNQMENVILNLTINARDAMPDGGVLRIATRDCRLDETPRDTDLAPGDYISLSIRDDGMGMSEDVRRRAVDPFFTTKPIGKGTGLGLSMAFGFVKQSKGDMRIESERNAGTIVTIFLPKADRS